MATKANFWVIMTLIAIAITTTLGITQAQPTQDQSILNYLDVTFNNGLVTAVDNTENSYELTINTTTFNFVELPENFSSVANRVMITRGEGPIYGWGQSYTRHLFVAFNSADEEVDLAQHNMTDQLKRLYYPTGVSNVTIRIIDYVEIGPPPPIRVYVPLVTR